MDNNQVVEESIDVKELLKPYLSKWVWFFVSIFLFAVLAIIYIKKSTPVYRLSSTVLIKDAKKMSSASGDFGLLAGLGGFGGMGTNSIQNEIEIFKSRKLIGEVITDLKLQTPVFSRESNYDTELYKATTPFNIIVVNEKQNVKLPKKPIDIKIEGNKITLSSKELKSDVVGTFNQTINFPFANLIFIKNVAFDANRAKFRKLELEDLYFVYQSLDASIDNYQKAINVDLVDKDATILGLELKVEEVTKGKDFLNKLVDNYNLEASTDKNSESKNTKEFIDERVNIIAKELGNVEIEKENFKTSNNIVDIAAEAKSDYGILTQSKLRDLQIESQLQLNNLLSGFLNKQSTSQTLPVNIGLDNEAVAKSIEQYNGLVLTKNKLLENATTDNPLVKDVDSQIRQLKGTLREGLDKNAAALNLTRVEAGKLISQSSSKIGTVPAKERLFRSIERQQQIKENLYLLLLQKREEAAVSLAITADKARVVDVAFADVKPVSPKKMIILGGAVLMGCLLPFGLIYLLQITKTQIETKQDIEKNSNTPVIAEIPRIAQKDNSIVHANDLSPLAESFRILATNLKFMLPKKNKNKTIFVTSTVKGEGKTFVSVNLGAILSGYNSKVLLIGSDIRNPQLQRYSPKHKTSLGLTEYLSGNIENVSEIINKNIFVENCDVIFSGAIPPNPTTLLENGKYKELLNSLGDEYEYIILDTAPLMLVTDSFIIADNADVTLYVTRSETTEKSFLNFANSAVSTHKINNPAFVLNDIHKTNFGYGNKYGYGYQQDVDRSLWEKIKNMF